MWRKPEFAGKLFKKGKSLKFWKERYYELKDGFLFYFADKNDYPKGFENLI